MINTFIERVWNIWTAGGWTMIPLAILGLMTYSAAVRMFLYFSSRDFHKIGETEWMRWLKNPESAKGEIGEIIRYTQDEVGSVDEIHSRFAEVVVSKMPFIDRNITFINILVTAAPLIGLLGTVMGMLMTFQSIGAGGGEMAEMMAAGISAALFPPEVGLCIALPGLLMVHLLKRKRDEYDAFLAKLESFTVQQYKKHGGEFVRKKYITADSRQQAGLTGEASALNPA
ncbi:MAG: MotA/TolQ/ExbB proton channel family protein [Verrucomicrobiota bacterium]|jgi:biopolymer transport protein ExbB